MAAFTAVTATAPRREAAPRLQLCHRTPPLVAAQPQWECRSTLSILAACIVCCRKSRVARSGFRRPEDRGPNMNARKGFDLDGNPLPSEKNLKGAAPWVREMASKRQDPEWARRYEVSNDKRGKGNDRFGARKLVSTIREKTIQAKSLFARAHRPRFSWDEVRNNNNMVPTEITAATPVIGTGEVCLSKFLAHCGACSRRNATELVLQGRVSVNGEIVTSAGVRVNPEKDKVLLDGQVQKLRTLAEVIWIMVNKPRGVVSTMSDPEGRKTVADLVPYAKTRRLVPVGRLERQTSGLLLLTNDYEWHSYLTHPRFEQPRRYAVEVYGGELSRNKMQALTMGLELPDEARPLRPVQDLVVMPDEGNGGAVRMKFTLTEGKYRQVRRMFEFLGHPVKSIKRLGFGGIRLDPLMKPGSWRQLTDNEINRLKGPTISYRGDIHPVDRMRMVSTFAASGRKEMDLDELKRSVLDESRRPEARRQPGQEPETDPQDLEADFAPPRSRDNWENNWAEGVQKPAKGHQEWEAAFVEQLDSASPKAADRDRQDVRGVR